LDRRHVHKILLSNCGFRENQLCKSYYLLWRPKLIAVRTFHLLVLYTSLKFGIRGLHIILLSICEFHENRHKGDRNFVTGVYEISFTRALLKSITSQTNTW
jgi:hypothetical protein